LFQALACGGYDVVIGRALLWQSAILLRITAYCLMMRHRDGKING